MKSLILQFLRLAFEKAPDILFKYRRALVFLLNVEIILVSMLAAIAVRFDFTLPPNYGGNFLILAVIFVLVKMLMIYIMGLNRGVWRYVSLSDIKMIFFASLFASLLLMFIFLNFRDQLCPNFALSVIVIDFLICFLSMSFVKVCVRMLREINDNVQNSVIIRTVVIGRLDDIDALLHGMSVNKTGRKIVAVFCPEKNSGATIRGIKIKGMHSKIAHFAKSNNIREIILIPPYSRKRLLNLLLAGFEKIDYNCSLKIVPGIGQLTRGEISFSNVRKVEMEDLLGRKPVSFDHVDIESLVSDKNVMVTGGGGSIGSELCCQIARFRPRVIVIFEICEYNLYEIERKLRHEFPGQRIQTVLGDIKDKKSLCAAMKKFSIEVLYHAAAYKHVPLLEENIVMGVYNNIIGTANVADCAEKNGVKRVVVISTDKAVRPTSMMGATKRIAERIVLERKMNGTEFVVVRFGNVLGSRGSVVPLFQKQIEAGGPVTVTSKNMIRYFMSIPEAAKLVLMAGTIASPGDIMILEMGQQINIYEMAKHLITLSGFMPHRDIEIKFTGIRPGEKEYEELLTKEEEVDHTSFERICVARKQAVVGPEISLDEIIAVLDARGGDGFRELCKTYIPENML
ncbi:MAG: nucleoside-diphosphate sugar epimerase/dehydratase [Victivallaceae bacterium]|nr:nucleoside-diphosphate sugar epimerase/dehydratase [Victivallaceae bacterium]